MGERSNRQRIVTATAPIRICDIGGWTDTWFAEHGKVLNIGVLPGVEVVLAVRRSDALLPSVVLDVKNFGDRYAYPLGEGPGRHPLLEAAIDEIGLPEKTSVEISVFSEVPAGSSTGTSASTAVALVGALDALTPGRMTPHQLATTAHRVETERLQIQSGVQDQLCAAFGGINFMEISPYPDAAVSPLAPPDATWRELQRRLVLVVLGPAHVSSTLHDHVIAHIGREGPDALPLVGLRAAAVSARDALLAGDLAAFGEAMIKNTEAQRRLYPGLVGTQAQLAIDIAASSGASGWKVNGAGGNGGSLTVLCGHAVDGTDVLGRSLRRADPRFKVSVPQLSSGGLRIRDGRM